MQPVASVHTACWIWTLWKKKFGKGGFWGSDHSLVSARALQSLFCFLSLLCLCPQLSRMVIHGEAGVLWEWSETLHSWQPPILRKSCWLYNLFNQQDVQRNRINTHKHTQNKTPKGRAPSHWNCVCHHLGHLITLNYYKLYTFKQYIYSEHKIDNTFLHEYDLKQFL